MTCNNDIKNYFRHPRPFCTPELFIHPTECENRNSDNDEQKSAHEPLFGDADYEASVAGVRCKIGQGSVIDGSVPRLDDSVPRLDESVPRLDDSVPRLDDSVPRLDDSVPRLDDSVPRLDDSTSRVDVGCLPSVHSQVPSPSIQSRNGSSESMTGSPSNLTNAFFRGGVRRRTSEDREYDGDGEDHYSSTEDTFSQLVSRVYVPRVARNVTLCSDL